MYVLVDICQLLVYNNCILIIGGNMKEKLEKLKDWILHHRKIVTSSIVIISIIFILLSSFLLNRYGHGDYEYIEILYYTSQIVSTIFVLSGVVIAVWQYYLSCVESKRNKDMVCVQRAIDLSEYYKDNILCYIAPIRYILNNSGISDILSKIDKSQIKHFDKKELDLYLSIEDIEKLKKIQNSNEFFDVVIKANLIYNLGLNEDVIKYYTKKKALSSTDSEILSTFLGKLITKVLNNTEYFALHFTHNVADKTVIYKSLHQTYISMIQMLYYNIASKNPLSPSKYFTNIIELYELWYNKEQEDEENYANGIRSLSNKGTVVENK